MFYLKLYALTVPVFFAIDMVWLGYIAKGFYQQNLAKFLSPNVNWSAALLFYLLYIAGILIFAVMPALEKDSAGRAMLLGGLFGFFTYATYDLTNLATLEGWPLKVAVVDIAWGAVLGAAVATCSFLIGRWIG
jgi:uncharacterized membrane protein